MYACMNVRMYVCTHACMYVYSLAEENFIRKVIIHTMKTKY